MGRRMMQQRVLPEPLLLGRGQVQAIANGRIPRPPGFAGRLLEVRWTDEEGKPQAHRDDGSFWYLAQGDFLHLAIPVPADAIVDVTWGEPSGVNCDGR